MHDGFYSCGTGAGRSNKAFLQVLTAQMRPGVRLAVMPVHLTAASSEYNRQWHAEMRALVRQAGGGVLPIDNGTGGTVRFGGLAAFQHACASAAALLHQHLLPSCDPLLIVAFDCPFYGLAAQLTPVLRPGLVLVARSTAALHAPDDTARMAWEHDGLQRAIASGGRVAAISAHMHAHLTEACQLPPHAVLDLPNGLTAADWRNIAAPDAALLPRAARSGFLLAMGRAAPYKGFDDLLDALLLLAERDIAVPHLLLAAVTDDAGLNDHQQHLAQRIATQGLNATLLPRFSTGLRSLLVHPALAAVVVPSRVEPFGRIPLEAFAAGAAPVVATTAGGLAELVTEQTGYPARPHDPASLAGALQAALHATTGDRARLRSVGRQLAIGRYNYARTVQDLLTRIAPWAIRQPSSSQAPRHRMTPG